MASVDPTLTTIAAPSVDLVAEPAWIALKTAATALQGLQIKNGSIPETAGDDGTSKSTARARLAVGGSFPSSVAQVTKLTLVSSTLAL